MNKLEEKMVGGAKKFVDNCIQKDFYRWPPVCHGIFNQPKKPEKFSKEQVNLQK